MYPLRVTGNINSITLPIGPKHSTSALSLILPHISKKSLTIKAFLNPFRYKVSKLLPAIPHTRHERSKVSLSLFVSWQIGYHTIF